MLICCSQARDPRHARSPSSCPSSTFDPRTDQIPFQITTHRHRPLISRIVAQLFSRISRIMSANVQMDLFLIEDICYIFIS